MPNTSIRNRTSALAVALSLSLLPLGLAACGGSSSTSSNASASNSNSTSTSTTAGAGAAGRNPGRFAALRSCLQKAGITLPQRPAGGKRTPGARAGGGGFLGGGGAGGGPQLPKGVTRTQLQNAMRKCGGGAFAGGARANNPAFQQSLVKFATCMRQNGVKLPAPSTTGGPVFNTKGLNTHSKAFTTAETKCQSLIRGSFRRGGGAPPAGGAGAPPAAGAPGAGAPGAGGQSQ